MRNMVQKVNPGMLFCLLQAADLPDAKQALAFVCGFQVMGELEPSGWWSHEEKPASLNLNEANNDRWHDSLERTIKSELLRVNSKEANEATWLRTREELEAGLVHGPFEREQLDKAFGKGSWRAMRRFGIFQNGKWRCCDNAKSLYNPISLITSLIIRSDLIPGL